ncbi:latent-transforming growth factor beta-binding protein 2 isoform X3 [Apus apus]|uniref:latent-transforming growth factor beta-binding protein 2 isoform X3 n=1 Tax=Apus apus TaxID=8895 RepID=UPI0021F86625|nr:latent-transforming growth factor beta-binding protein 2 isoform X3 [Apus apus]
MRGAAASLLPLTFAVLLGFARCGPDSAARLEPGSAGAARPRSQGAALGATGTTRGLSPLPGAPPPARPLPVALHVAAAGGPSGGDGRRQRPHGGLPAPRSQAGDAGLGPGPGQGNRLDPSGQRQGSRPKARVVPRAKEPSGRGRMVGPNVCSRQCCPGWTTAPGTNRCIKPVCDPPCQNKGSCSRPQVCTCRSGFQGSRCEEVVPEQEYHPPGAAAAFQAPASSLRRRTSTAGRDTSLRGAQAPIPRHTPAVTRSRIGSPVSPQHTGPSRTVRRYPATNAQLTSNALPNGNGHEQSSSGPHMVSQEHTLSTRGANLTEKIRKIKIVFTPTICKQTCRSGRCYNSCEKGDTTTLYSQGGHDHDPKSGFRIYFCQIPCLNGGRCVGRDECWCPSNSTGKFCHLPAPSLEKKQGGRAPKTLAGSSMKHSTYTLPLSNQLASLNPSLVNVHINHPPEATVQIHQVARVRGDTEVSEENSVEAVLVPQLAAVPWYTYAHGNGNSIATEGGQQQQRAPGLLGRCFQEALHGQCTNPLPGLTKLEDCCGSVGLFWGVDRCLACPPRPAHPVNENGQVECPQGYKRLNRSHCQDINECLMQGVCKDAECVNTRGSFRCTCKPGTMLDPSRSHCISDKAVSMEQGLCYRSAAGGVCSFPLSHHITQQICCCSRVGKGWGKNCEACPVPGSEAFKEICPAGHGYTYSSSDIRLSMRKAEAEELPFSLEEQGESSNWTLDWAARRHRLQNSLRGSILEAFPHPGTSVAEGEVSHAVQGAADATAEPATRRAEEEESWRGRPHPGPTTTWDAPVPTQTPAQGSEASGCAFSPLSCGAGACVLTPEGYSCLCHPGYMLDPSHLLCIDEDECLKDPCAGKGRCINSVGSYFCLCYSGYTLSVSGGKQSCQDRDECEQPSTCQGQRCVNTPGSYRCECKEGFAMGPRGQCEDINECVDPSPCPLGKCVNTLGSYKCVSCGDGYWPRNGRCVDVDECLAEGTCAHGRCVNLDGSFRCYCYRGYEVAPDGKSCQDIDECTAQAACPSGLCLNTEGSYSCMACDAGYTVSRDGSTCEDMDECENPAVQCQGGECRNTLGSYKCHCQAGFELINGTMCEDVNECELMVAVCGTALCENVEGSFLCLCPSDHEEYDTEAGQCQPRAPVEGPETHAAHLSDSAERKQCYYHISDVRLCDSVLAKNITKEECCCTVGAAWGDNCETYPCPIPGTVEYQEICPLGKGYIPQEDLLSGKVSFTDMDECDIFGSEFCRNGQCLNTVPGYKCFCRTGYFYDSSRLECVDQDECQNEVYCINGECLNTDGSYHCFCSLPLVLDATGNRCVNLSIRADTLEEYEIHLDVCWQTVANYICQDLLHGEQTTYTECCCRLGEAWGQNCALCPHRSSADFAFLCNGASEDTERWSELRERPRYEYGPGLEDPHYGLPNPDMGPYYNYLESEYGSPDAGVPRREPNSEFHGSPLHHGPGRSPPRYLPGQTGLYEGFEGLQAEECGILNGCENGRCVRVREGYTCDCFDGFQLDMTRMACVDINECEEVGNPEPLCQGGTCENTEGSYRCHCSPGYVALARPHHCVPQIAQSPAAA